MTARFTPPPRLDPQRIGILCAFDALIELRLDTTRNAEPLAAERLLRWLETTGCATVTAKADRTRTVSAARSSKPPPSIPTQRYTTRADAARAAQELADQTGEKFVLLAAVETINPRTDQRALF
jgi:ribosomal protein L11 methylase PrmA